ncbi:MAG: hypothetical protein AVO38_09055 [delta proteobacterium ML8_D]|nr:MAG: hypothetical protein AVO38_09055 [delta proteobacterium ML8_D]
MTFMKNRPLQALIYLSLFACAIIGVQVLIIIITEEAFCINDGCKIVEKLTLVPPLYFNLLGVGYFFAVLCTALITKSKSGIEPVLGILLISGLAAAGVLLGYQIFVANVFCFYCLLVFLLIVSLNMLMGLRQLTLGLIMIVVQLFIFSLLRFEASEEQLRGLTLDNGTYAVKTCSKPVKQLYLIFSKDCPHCYKVIESLEGCTRCEFHFNPVKKISADILPGLRPNKQYLPQINTNALKILGIDTIPVLIARDHDGFTFIEGERNIINYIQNTCFQERPSLDEGLENIFGIEGGACFINENY